MSSSDASASSSTNPIPVPSSGAMSSIVSIDPILFVKSSEIRPDGDVIFNSRRTGVLYNTVLEDWWEIYERSRHCEKDACVAKIAEAMVVNRGIRFLCQVGGKSSQGYRIEPNVTYKIKKKVKRDIRDFILQKYSELGLTRKQILLREEAVKKEQEKKRADEMQQRKKELSAFTTVVAQPSTSSNKSESSSKPEGVHPTDEKLGMGHLVSATAAAEHSKSSRNQPSETQVMLSVPRHAVENGTDLPFATNKTLTEPHHHQPALPSYAPFSPFMEKTPISFEEMLDLDRQYQGPDLPYQSVQRGADTSSGISSQYRRDSLSTVSKTIPNSESEGDFTVQEIAELGELLKVEDVSEGESSMYFARKTTTMTNTTTVTRVNPSRDSFKLRAQRLPKAKSGSTSSSVGGAQKHLRREIVEYHQIARQEFEREQRTSDKKGELLGALHSRAGVGSPKRSQPWAEETTSNKKRSHSLDLDPVSPISEPITVRSNHEAST